MGFDDLTTPAGRRREVAGGSALYFSLAAHRLCEVRVVAAIGTDGRSLLDILDAANIDRSGVAQLPGLTYRWRAEHHPTDAVPVTEEQQLGVYLDWRPALPLPARESEILFLGSMHPSRQLEVLAQCPGAQLVALDTMRDFITSDRGELEQILHRVDMLFANETELRALLPSPPVEVVELAAQALSRWSLRSVILKLGPAGVVAVSRRGTARTFAAAPGPPVVDPTGAGDALAGGLLGRLAQLRRGDDDAIDLAMVDGAGAARAAIAAFGVPGLLAPET
ncbi:MAG TPA: PfkB family carbohydrate kinase [Candidatus Acidoferrales bacterium]|nr:PfkB family carbohydrate kinase [Candidatus Acidoferrales bacterium]